MSAEEMDLQELMQALSELRSKLPPIDRFNLEEECAQHAQLYDEVGNLAVTAKSLTRTAKNELDFLESDLKSKVRKDPESYGLKSKPTNDAISDKVATQEEVRDAKVKHIDACRLSDAFSVLQTAMEQRKGNLRNLVNLYVHNYYSSQNVPGHCREMDKTYEQEMADQRQQEIEADQY